jgi:cytochrome P450
MRGLWERFRDQLHLRKIDVYIVVSRTILRSRFIMAVFRRFPRLAKLPSGRLIVHHRDVVEALEGGRSFGVPYLAKMMELGGYFVLGLDEGPEHDELRAAVEQALEGCDLDALHVQSRGRAEEQLAGRNHIEVVRALTDPVLRSTVGHHLWSGHVTGQQLDDSRAVFRDIFINPLKDPRVSRPARDAGKRLRYHLTGEVIEHLARKPSNIDVFDRLLADHRLDTRAVIDQGIGLLVAWVASVSRGMAFALDALFRQPDGFALAVDAARAADREAMTNVLTEAFRFVPPAPAVERVCRREAPLRRRPVRREADIAVVITSAMMDADVIEEPGRFRADRPCRHDLTFGHGKHACLGRDIAEAQLSGILIALLRRPNLKWAYGIKLDGPYPHRLEVTWSP